MAAKFPREKRFGKNAGSAHLENTTGFSDIPIASAAAG
jgi:hypothetical protein